jgi:hypothetical protein
MIMKYFLERIAAHLLDEYGDRLERQCLVFPNRRAGLYFMKYLATKAGKPVWAPTVKTINELFRLSSGLHVAETEILIFELYKVYRLLNPGAESFDDFYFWGEMIINDFDDVDKYLADASKIFSNLSDLKKIDNSFGELTEEQVSVIRQFWVHFNAGAETRAKSDFISLWSILPALYTAYRQSLISRGLAYEGMIFRELAEKCSGGHIPVYDWDTFHFIGFNALNNCEKSLLMALKSRKMAKFYWDFDQSYISGNTSHSAGYFIRPNLKAFGNDMPADWDYNTNLAAPTIDIKREIIDTSSNISQVKLIPGLLKKIGESGSSSEAGKTAIILADENLLIPLLSTIPESVEDINITMGYPLKLSPVYSLVKNVLQLQQNSMIENGTVYFDHTDVFSILRHGFFSDEDVYHSNDIIAGLVNENMIRIPSEKLNLNDAFRLIFRRISEPQELPSYIRSILELGYTETDPDSEDIHSGNGMMIRNEFIYRIMLIINRIESSILSGGISLTTSTFSRLLDKILRGISIPFTGEPLKGLQVMGILETRALDFRNIIFLSVNEGTLPRSSAGSSYIPYNLREAYGLPTIRHQDSIYAYYFYRLLHKCENITYVYNSSSDGLKSGEMSRFLLQLNYLYKKPPEPGCVSFEISISAPDISVIRRTDKHSAILSENFTGPSPRPLSPSALNTWLSCRMKFYYRYVCRLKESERMQTGIDPAIFGEVLHSVMENIYTPFRGKNVLAGELDSLSRNESLLMNKVLEIIAKKFHNGIASEVSGNEQIIASIIATYTKSILKKDAGRAPFTIADLEKKTGCRLHLHPGNPETGIFTGGIIDRLDRTSTELTIIDYKTGNVSMEIKSLLSLFDENEEKRNEAWFQILMYSEILMISGEKMKIIPSVYPVRSLIDRSFTGRLRIKDRHSVGEELNDYSEIRDEFRKGLEETFRLLFNNDSDFIMTPHTHKCEFCQYRQLCRR